jgi:hypothetical protein
MQKNKTQKMPYAVAKNHKFLCFTISSKLLEDTKASSIIHMVTVVYFLVSSDLHVSRQYSIEARRAFHQKLQKKNPDIIS